MKPLRALPVSAKTEAAVPETESREAAASDPF